jgi:ferric-dicitrate binding protein FerR (iron transport regulator)
MNPERALDRCLENLGEPGASRAEVVQSADRLLRVLEREYERMPEPRRPAWRVAREPYRLGWAAAAVLAVALLGGLMLLLVDRHSIGTLAAGTIVSVAPGETLTAGKLLPVGDGGAELSLAGGSRAELSSQSAFSVTRVSDGLELHLIRGNVLITAAKQERGQLYVRTADCIVSVTGTVFSVRAEETGSRVTVYEGQVQVVQGDRFYKVGAGDQIVTSSLMGASTLQAEVAWSRNAPAVLALLQGPEVTPVLPGSEAIEGVLTNLTTGQPLANAAIRVSERDPARVITEVKTAADGRFRIGKILPGAYQLAPSLDGFWASDPPGAGVTLGPGQAVRNLRLLMVGSATVSGRVTDEMGQPVPNRKLSLQRLNMGGLNYDHEARGGRTNARGEYEFTRVRPGKYYIQGMVPLSVSVYHPGTANLDDAVAVHVRPGTATTGIDLKLPAVKSYAVRFTVPKSALLWFDAVYGKMANPMSAFGWQNARTPSRQPPASPVLDVTLQSNTRVFDREVHIRNVVTLKGDDYLIPQVLPGRYRLKLLWKSEHDYFPAVSLIVPRAAVEVDVEVIDRNVDLGELASKPRDLSIPVRFIFENGAESDVTLLAMSGEVRNEVTSMERPAMLKHLAEGTYSVGVPDLPPDRYVSRMTYSGQDVLSSGLVLDGVNSGTLEVVIDGPGGSVEGIVRGVKGEAISNARVVLGNRSVMSDKEGVFRFPSVRPGEYRLQAWEFALPGVYLDPEWRREYETRGTVVSVRKGETVYAEVRRIPATN